MPQAAIFDIDGTLVDSVDTRERGTRRWSSSATRTFEQARTQIGKGGGQSAKTSELDVYLDIAGIKDLVDVATSSKVAEQSKPAPDIFQVALTKLGSGASEAVAIGDTPDDADPAGKAGIPTIGMLCGGFTEADLRKAGCLAVYPGPGALLACFGASPLGA